MYSQAIITTTGLGIRNNTWNTLLGGMLVVLYLNNSVPSPSEEDPRLLGVALDAEHPLLMALFEDRGHVSCHSAHGPLATFEHQYHLYREIASTSVSKGEC